MIVKVTPHQRETVTGPCSPLSGGRFCFLHLQEGSTLTSGNLVCLSSGLEELGRAEEAFSLPSGSSLSASPEQGPKGRGEL